MKEQRKFFNIEFIFLLLLGIATLMAFSMSILTVVNINIEDPYYGLSEFAGMIFMLTTIYFLVFLIWQVKLWRFFISNNKRKWVQLSIVFIFSILPMLPFLINYIIGYLLAAMAYLNFI
jgi:hypothetical protein